MFFNTKILSLIMIDKIIWLILLTFVPTLELRWSIPIGLFDGVLHIPLFGEWVGFGLPIEIVFPVVVIANIFLGIIIYFLLDNFVHLLIRIKRIEKIYNYFVIRTQKNSKNLIEKYGLLGIAIFIAIPLPGSGSYTGALAAYLLGMGYKKFFIANAIGVIIAGIIVTIVSLGLFSLF